MRDLAEEYLLLRVTALLDGWSHSLTSGDAGTLGAYLGLVDTTGSNELAHGNELTELRPDSASCFRPSPPYARRKRWKRPKPLASWLGSESWFTEAEPEFGARNALRAPMSLSRSFPSELLHHSQPAQRHPPTLGRWWRWLR
uniref:Uncharacterized protein n=1 Tax=Oryza punctata TaxID=4537 RepID=A0A0E0LZC2_ORYPU